jgi:hypothetical protein
MFYGFERASSRFPSEYLTTKQIAAISDRYNKAGHFRHDISDCRFE